MTSKADFANHIVDLLTEFGTVETRRMFGSFGLFHQGLMIGLVSEGSLYLKADDQSIANFEAEGSTPFTYIKKEKLFTLRYYLAPESFFEDEQQTIEWAKLAFDAALRNPNKKEKPSKSENHKGTKL